ncbi:isoprenylcysteine carboxylmethyltransferase family protein [Photobacterium sanctipauli]|uniref:Isoprenylcysteine carboxylmethyltransferase family protein n=1 Tax=Photobacterium sanctipauli TaxID=1342794 RepID=A0A2T3NUB8_9GAMM|nr:isoprenylcysteine carboxylmethyltransferase family protein [Photobacterium sanctipauli]PSW19880.1 isoprenylcysteine carboxylmethyltransferase family protein [Photobacterium sanctipauli]
MNMKLPPPLIFLLALAGMYGLSVYWPLVEFSFPGQRMLLLLFLLLGTLVSLAAVMSFARVRTTIDPRYPNKTSYLVTKGVFSISRNPMYLGLLCFLLAAFIYLAALSAFIAIVLFVFFITMFQIQPEEEVLEAMFGDEYRDYCNKVRRWI